MMNQPLLSSPAIAIVGIACQYPDARSPQELWQNVLAQRQAFRRIPAERLSLNDYFSTDHDTPDCTYSKEAAVIEGYHFDRVGFRIVGSTFRSADLAHWLALDIASQALADAGFTEGTNLPRETTGVLLGNTLTGDLSRANVLRLRWPYVRRVVEAQLIEQEMPLEERHVFLTNLETLYKKPFPPIGEESLAGNLSNTIAGRICNHFDLKGGGYTVDGACSSSLLAVSHACNALITGDLDVVLAGGVDLSLDPFELIGFAKAGALASEEMRIYDTRSAGFLPGEGCGLIVLMRYEDAIIQNKQIYSVIRGWGISSDGHGGITRPEVEGQLLAIKRAYRRAGFGINTVNYLEGHGTGTNVGDTTELKVLNQARLEANNNNIQEPVAIGSIKANVGHTKAAAGIAGLIKTIMALHTQILPPTTGCETPHSELTKENPALRILRQGQIWPETKSLRAAVSSMGFGGINTHIVLEGLSEERRQSLSAQENLLLASHQDAELILIAAETPDELNTKINHLLTIAPRLSRAEVGDLAAELAKNLNPKLPVRAAIVAHHPQKLTQHLNTLQSWLSGSLTKFKTLDSLIFLGIGHKTPKIGFVFPGQASPVYLDGGIWERRFHFLHNFYKQSNLPKVDDIKSTVIAQPAIVSASLVGLQVLEKLGLKAEIGLGHSLGELTALHWAGAFDAKALLGIAKIRGQAMAELGSPTGIMASLMTNEQEVIPLLKGQNVVIAGINSPYQTVISGESIGVNKVMEMAKDKGIKSVHLPVSHAFHSPLIAKSAKVLAEHLQQENFQSLQMPIVSTVTGSFLDKNADLPSLLCQQVTSPVRFIEAASTASQDLDLFVEVGPGQILRRLLTDFTEVPIVSLDASGSSIKGLLQAAGAGFVLGCPLNYDVLFIERFTRSFNLNWQPQFFVNPCELAPIGQGREIEVHKKQKLNKNEEIKPLTNPREKTVHNSIECVRQLVAQKTELPPTAIHDEHRLLSDLHLNSITVSQLVAEAARSLSLSPPTASTDYADATVAEIAQALEQLADINQTSSIEQTPSGVELWIRTFKVELVESPELGEKKHKQILSFDQESSWQIFTSCECSLSNSLKTQFNSYPGKGVIVCLASEADESQIELLLKAAKTILESKNEQNLGDSTRFVLVKQGRWGDAFARTFYLENPQVITCVINLPWDHPQALNWIVNEVTAAIDYSEAYYDTEGKRRTSVLDLLPIPEQKNAKLTCLSAEDVLLVTGGGKGIAAECALSIAKETGVRLAILGRSQPEADQELLTNLERMKTAGIQLKYISADVTDEIAIQNAFHEIETELGVITAIIHGAGINKPKLIKNLDINDCQKTIAPKVRGLQNLLANTNPNHLKLLITFGSIIARIGLPGEADYALANEWLDILVEQWQAQYPSCRCLNIEWSVWSGTGMGERLGRTDILMQQGITPITTDRGISLLRNLIQQPLPTHSVVVTGRFGEPVTLKRENPELPFLRFLENPKVYYPGVELIVEAELSTATDPYLNDHIYEGERIFPGVMGLEAMAQVAMALLRTSEIPIFAEVKFNRPIIIGENSSLKIRIAALLQESGQVDVVIRSEQTNFGIDHFQASLKIKQPSNQSAKKDLPLIKQTSASCDYINPKTDLYGEIFFHTGRFQRIRNYRHLRATECIAQIEANTQMPWFSYYLPKDLLLGDPGARDAVIHALQACVPHATILPTGIDKLTINSVNTVEECFVHGKEREQNGNMFIYDLIVVSEDGTVLESWEGLHLQIIKYKDPQNPWRASLIAPYLERLIKEVINIETLVIQPNTDLERRERSSLAIKEALGSLSAVNRRPDGKPEVLGIPEQTNISVAHSGLLTLSIYGQTPIACDMEQVMSKASQSWLDLLGSEKFALVQMLAQEINESIDLVATRIWTAIECLKKASSMVNAPLVFENSTKNGLILLKSGNLIIVTLAIFVHEFNSQVVVAVLGNN